MQAHDRVWLFTGDRKIARVRVASLRVHGHEFAYTDWSRRARRSPGDSAHWRFRLPDELGDANTIDVNVRYRHNIGNAEYAFGIKRR